MENLRPSYIVRLCMANLCRILTKLGHTIYLIKNSFIPPRAHPDIKLVIHFTNMNTICEYDLFGNNRRPMRRIHEPILTIGYRLTC